MSDFKLTPEQHQAVFVRGKNLLVAAGAGSGKTAVLIRRIIERITDPEDPVDVDRFLVVTYTRAAANEMRQRLDKALREKLALNPANSFLARQVVLLQRAQITTLHSFCLDTVKKYFYLVGLDPKLRIGSAAELAVLQENVLERVFEEEYAAEDSPLIALMDAYGSSMGDDKLKSLVKRVVEFAYSMPEPFAWIENLAAPYIDFNILPWLECLMAEIRGELEYCRDTYEYLVNLAADEAAGLGKYRDLAQKEFESLTVLAELGNVEATTENWDKLVLGISGMSFGRLPSIRQTDGHDPDSKQLFTTQRDAIKKSITKLAKKYYTRTAAAVAEEARQLQPLAQALVQLCTHYLTAWQQEKKAASLVEFSDLEHYCLEILQDEEVRADIRAELKEVFVDEYQDINAVQEAILNAVSSADNCFMVGDVKQSIYRFRMADPGLFINKYDDFGCGAGGRRIDLAANFRSEPNIIAAVNFIFRQLMVGAQLEVNYDQAAELKAGRPAADAPPAELLILDKSCLQTAEDEDDVATAEAEARLVAARILKAKEEGFVLRDMAILLRSPKAVSGVYQQVLAAFGIPCRADGSEDIFAAAEVDLIISLLRIIDNPLQDVEMAAVLHSPMVGLALPELADLHLLAPEAELYECLKLSADVRVQKFLQQLELWRSPDRRAGIADFLDEVYRDTGILEIMRGLEEGEQRCRNLQVLMSIAADYDQNSYRGLYGFLVWLERLKERGAESAAPAADPNAVTLMSIHRSKGLEFPVVFVSGLGKRFNTMDLHDDVLLHRELGLGLKLVNRDRGIKYPSLPFLALSARSEWELCAEELRVLYVALTRAKERLYMVGTASVESFATRCLRAVIMPEVALPSALVGSCSSYLDWLGMALIRHKDGAELFDAAGAARGTRLVADNSRWQVSFVNELPSVPVYQAEEEWELSADVPVSDEVKELLDWEYSGLALCRTPVKWSATSMKKSVLWEEEYSSLKSEKAQAEQTNYETEPQGFDRWAELGTLIHSLYEKIDLQRLAAGEPAEDLLAELLAAADADDELKARVNCAELALLFQGEVGAQLLQAHRSGNAILREGEFTLHLSVAEAEELLPGWQEHWNLQDYGDEKLFFQGVIDLAFQTADGWVLVDFKSGHRHNKTDAELREQYGLQIQLYKEALTRITGWGVAAAYLYYTNGGRWVSA